MRWGGAKLLEAVIAVLNKPTASHSVFTRERNSAIVQINDISECSS
jgi:hypothetical protein